MHIFIKRNPRSKFLNYTFSPKIRKLLTKLTGKYIKKLLEIDVIDEYLKRLHFLHEGCACSCRWHDRKRKFQTSILNLATFNQALDVSCT